MDTSESICLQIILSVAQKISLAFRNHFKVFQTSPMLNKSLLFTQLLQHRQVSRETHMFAASSLDDAPAIGMSPDVDGITSTLLSSLPACIGAWNIDILLHYIRLQ